MWAGSTWRSTRCVSWLAGRQVEDHGLVLEGLDLVGAIAVLGQKGVGVLAGEAWDAELGRGLA
jgi:hypothetical protein